MFSIAVPPAAADLLDNDLRRPVVGAGAVDRATEIVHDDVRAFPCELERVAPPDATAGARDDRDATFADTAHRCDPLA